MEERRTTNEMVGRNEGENDATRTEESRAHEEERNKLREHGKVLAMLSHFIPL